MVLFEILEQRKSQTNEMNICFLFSLDNGTCWVHLLMWWIEFCNKKTAWFMKNKNK